MHLSIYYLKTIHREKKETFYLTCYCKIQMLVSYQINDVIYKTNRTTLSSIQHKRRYGIIPLIVSEDVGLPIIESKLKKGL